MQTSRPFAALLASTLALLLPPLAVVTADPAAAAITRHLTDLPPVSATNGHGPVEWDRSNGEYGAGDGTTLTLQGQTFARGLGVHPASDVRYVVPDGCTQFSAVVGVDDEVGGAGSVVFEVFTGSSGNSKVYDSGVRTGNSANAAVSLPVAAGHILRLVVHDAGDGLVYDHADWADAKFSCDTAAQPPAAPTTVSATNDAEAGTATLSWQPPTATGGAAVTGYRVSRNGTDSHGAGPWSTTLAATARTFTFYALVTGSTYQLSVEAINSAGTGAAASTSVTLGQDTSNVALFPYSRDSVWKLGISSAAAFESPNDTKTAALLNNGQPGDGQVWVNSQVYSHHMEYAKTTDPMITMTDTSDASRTSTYRIPATARPSVPACGPPDYGDAHLHVLQPDGYTLMEAFCVTIDNAGTSQATYRAGRVATSDLRSNGLGPQKGTRAYGGGAMAGLIRRHEVDPNSPDFQADPRYPGQNVPLIKHPLAYALRDNQLYHDPNHIEYGYYGDDAPLDSTRHPGWPVGQSRLGFMRQSGYVWPASEQDYDSVSGYGHYTGPVPMGTYFAIPAGVAPPASASKEALAVFHAMQDYGAYVTDRSGALSLYVEYGPSNGPAEAFAEALRGADLNVAPLRSVLGLARVVTNNTSSTPNGGPLGSSRRGGS